MAGNVKLMTSAGGGVILDTATTTATDVTVKVPVTDVNNGTLVCSNSSGNVGIGTSPSYRLHVSGSSVVGLINSSNNTNVLAISYNSTVGGYIGANGTNLVFANNSAVEAMRIDSSSNLKFNSGYGSVATAYGCRAWVNFSGTTNAIRASGNVSSITDNGTADYTVNFSVAMPDANYATVLGGDYAGASDNSMKLYPGGTYSTTAVRMQNVGSTFAEGNYCCVAIFR